MARVFAPDSTYNSTMGYADFINGAAVIPEGDSAAEAYFTAEDFDVDTNKHILTPIDKLSRADVNNISTYFGVALDQTDTKYEVIRKIEGAISVLKIGAPLTVASTPGTDSGQTQVAVTEGLTGANVHRYKIHPTVAPAPLYGDTADDTWTDFTSGDATIDATDGHLITVVECNPVTGFIYHKGSATVDSKQ